jgi:hypothetical protein
MVYFFLVSDVVVSLELVELYILMSILGVMRQIL